MSELRALLGDTTDKVLANLSKDDATAWDTIAQSGLANVMVPEDEGGFGGGWEDAFVVLRASGLYATQISLADALVEPVLKNVSDQRRLQLMALARACQMAGAMQGALNLSVRYTRERSQFGKALSTFQAIQQQLAVFAEETAATNMAAVAACRAADRGHAEFEIAAAKLRANMAVGTTTSVAHQVHGAMGFTAEYGLHHFTRRLWEWRSEYGNDRFWANQLGTFVSSKGAANFWPTLVNPATMAASFAQPH